MRPIFTGNCHSYSMHLGQFNDKDYSSGNPFSSFDELHDALSKETGAPSHRSAKARESTSDSDSVANVDRISVHIGEGGAYRHEG